MIPDMQNPRLAPRASRDMLGGSSHLFLTAADWRTQLIATRFRLSPNIARQVSALHYGETTRD